MLHNRAHKKKSLHKNIHNKYNIVLWGRGVPFIDLEIKL